MPLIGQNKGQPAAGEGPGRNAIEEVTEELQRLNRNVEHEFLELAGKLMDFVRAVDCIAAGLQELTEAISGASGQRASAVYQSALERARQMEARTVERITLLDNLRNSAGLVRTSFFGFSDSIRTFLVLCTLTRIEAMRLGGVGTGFASLADDAKSLVGSMRSKVNNVLESAAHLDERTAHTLECLSVVDAVVKNLSPVITEAMANLNSFSERQGNTVAVSARLAAQSAAVAACIKDAIGSIQFHDITRQQVEHVIEALKLIGSAGACGSSLPCDVARILTVQCQQLAKGEERFGSAAQHLMLALDHIARSVQEMAEAGACLTSDSRGQTGSFFFKMERCMTALLDAFGGYNQGEAAAEIATRELGTILSSARRAATEIDNVGREVLLLALNARISAEHMGPSAAPLGVISDALKEFAITSRQRSEAAVEALSAVTRPAVRLDPRDSNASTSQAAVLDEMRGAIRELHSWSEASAVRIKDITVLSTRLSEDISTTTKNFRAGRMFSDVVTRCRAELMRIAGSADAWTGGEMESAGTLLEDVARHYTMQTECDVHSAVVIGAGADSFPYLRSDAPGATPADEEKEHLGDNFELF